MKYSLRVGSMSTPMLLSEWFQMCLFYIAYSNKVDLTHPEQYISRLKYTEN